MTKDPKILALRDLEGQRLFAAIVTLVGFAAAIYGVGQLLKLTDVTMTQVEELSGRVEHLSRPAAVSTSEPAKT
jgi:hypothetical protein